MNWTCKQLCHSKNFPLRLSYIFDYRIYPESKTMIRAVNYTWKERMNGQKRCAVCEYVTADPCNMARCPCCNGVLKIQLKGSNPAFGKSTYIKQQDRLVINGNSN